MSAVPSELSLTQGSCRPVAVVGRPRAVDRAITHGSAGHAPLRRTLRGVRRQLKALFLPQRSLFGPVGNTALAAENDYQRFCNRSR